MKVKSIDLIIGSSVLLLGALGLWVFIPYGVVIPDDIDIAALSPAFWPKMVMMGLMFAGGIVFFQGLFPKTSEQYSEAGLGSITVLLKVVAVISIMFLYYLGINKIGIVLSSVVVLLLLMLLGGEKRFLTLAAISMLLPILLFYFFTYVANVPLPLGMFE